MIRKRPILEFCTSQDLLTLLMFLKYVFYLMLNNLAISWWNKIIKMP